MLTSFTQKPISLLILSFRIILKIVFSHFRPTRVTSHSKTLIDNIFSNFITNKSYNSVQSLTIFHRYGNI